MGVKKLCKGCGKPIIVLTDKTKYCSDECRRKSYYKKRPLVRTICKQCYKQFTTRISTKVFCSIKCKNTFHKEGIVKDKICKYCKSMFSVTNDKKKYCSKKCYLAQKRIRDGINYKRKTKYKIEGYNT